jgi:hypothetical protein
MIAWLEEVPNFPSGRWQNLGGHSWLGPAEVSLGPQGLSVGPREMVGPEEHTEFWIIS